MSSERIELNLEDADKVTGGSLYAKYVDGIPVLERLNGNHEVIARYPILTSVDEVMEAMKSTYWSLDEGKRDNQMLQILYNNGQISKKKI